MKAGIVAVLSLAVLALVWFLVGGHESGPRAVVAPPAAPVARVTEPAPRREPDLAQPTPAPIASSTTAPPAQPQSKSSAPKQKVVDVLRAYWGRDWDKVEPKIQGRIDTNATLAQPLVPWEEAQPHFEDLIKVSDADVDMWRQNWFVPPVVTREYLTGKFPIERRELTDADVQAAADLVKNLVRDGGRTLDQIRAMVDKLAKAKFIAGKFDHGPLVSVDMGTGERFWMQTVAYDQWTVTISVSQQEAIGISASIDQLRDIQQQIFTTLSQFAAAKNAR